MDADEFARSQMQGGLVSTLTALTGKLPSYIEFHCGQFTYGVPRVWAQPLDEARRLTIGEFCSIGPEVQIFVGRHGRHQTTELSTYPLVMLAPPEIRSATQWGTRETANLDVEIGSDVWIGSRVTILAGVSIGHGAVVGTGAVVTKDVAPYAVVLGVPARHSHYRLSNADVREALLLSRWWELPLKDLWNLYRADSSDEGLLDFAAQAEQRMHELGKGTPVTASRDLRQPAGDVAAPSSYPSLAAFGNAILKGELRSPRLPDSSVQLSYTGAEGEQLMQRSLHFIDYLHDKLPELARSDWRGLDFGVGWGRLAMLMQYFGTEEQLDVADAWEKSLQLLDTTGLRNRRILVPEILGPESSPLKPSSYHFAYAFSLFTHLPRTVYLSTLQALLNSLHDDGVLTITIRPEKFIDFYAARQPPGKVPPWNGEEWFVPTYSQSYGESVLALDVLEGALEGQARVVDVTTPNIDPLQVYVTIRRTS